jgi:hypothetical protein
LNEFAPPRQLRRSVAPFDMATKPNLFAFSVFCGVGITFLLALLAFGANSRPMACTFAWQSCLIQAAIIPANSREGTPLDLLLFLFGLLLGVPMYSALTYAVVTLWRRTRIRNER